MSRVHPFYFQCHRADQTKVRRNQVPGVQLELRKRKKTCHPTLNYRPYNTLPGVANRESQRTGSVLLIKAPTRYAAKTTSVQTLVAQPRDQSLGCAYT